MKTEIEISKKDEETLKAGNTETLRTVPGTERVIADFEKGEPIVHKDESQSSAFRRTANLVHVNLVSDTSA